MPREVRDVQRHYQDAYEAQPDVFIRYKFPTLLSASRTAIAAYLEVPRPNVVYVTNATTALNTVLRDLRFASNDVCIYFSTIYGSIEKTLIYLTETTPLRLSRIKLVHPLPDNDVVKLFRSAVATIRAQGLTPRVALYDTISSLPGIRCPYEQLTAVCREEGILSCIDGAHGVGHIPLDLTKLDPDFFVTNLHKWLHVPRPCAVLYVPQRNQPLIRSTLPTSHGFVPKGYTGTINNPLPGSGEVLTPFEINFEFVGTLDSSAYLTIASALKWRSRVVWGDKKGEEAIMGYCMDQARKAGQIMARMLSTDVLENQERTLGRCCFSNVTLPLDYDELVAGAVPGGAINFDKVVEIARWIEEELVREHSTFMGVIFHGRAWMIRLSAQVYLTLEDWERGSRWLKQVCDKVKERKW